MLVLHGWWESGERLVLWGEDAAAALPAPRPGRPPAGRPHPFAADADQLPAALAALTGTPDAGRLAHRELLLPTVRGVPQPSPELVREDVPPEGPTRGLTWRVPVVELEAAAALDVLRSAMPDDLSAGSTWRHLREIAALAEDLAGRGRVLPVVLVPPVPTAGLRPWGARAVWRPLVTGADASWVRSLALALPPAGLGTAGRVDRDPAPGRSPAQAVAEALDTLLDAAVRRRLSASGIAGPGPAASGPAWLAALTSSGDGFFEASAGAVAAVSAELARWQRDVVGGPARARFRLVEPSEGGRDELWLLEFALQSTAEPSVVAPASQVWAAGRAGKDAADALSRLVPAPRAAFLAELGRASRLYPDLERALRAARPEGLSLDTAGAHLFLREAAPMLAAAGFGVDLPGWWGRPAGRLGARLRASARTQPGVVAGLPGIGRDALVDYRWEVALGEERLDAEELARLAELQQPLVRMRGRWVELDPRQLKRGLELLSAPPQAPLTLAEVLGLAATLDEETTGLPVIGVEGEGWVAEVLSSAADERVDHVPAPPGFDGTLRPYQERGVAWLSFLDRVGLGGVLADDMGLGKTVQILALLALDRLGAPDGREGAATLIVCPMSLVGNWQREAERFTPDLRVHVHHGSDRARGEDFERAVAESDVVVTTYAIAARDTEVLREIPWRRVVLDEAQAVKNAATRQARAVRSLAARQRVAVTGTPVENRLADLWAILDATNPGILGNAAAFTRRFAVPIERHGDEDAADRLRTVTRPFVLRRVKTDRSIIADLPDKLEMEVVCSLTREQATLYQAVVDDMLAKVEESEGIERRGLVLATMTKLKQVCNHPAQLLRDGSPLAGRSGKLERVEAIVEEVLAGGERALLFTQFAEFGAMLRAHLSARFAREVLFLHGGVPKKERDGMVARFQAGAGRGDPGAPALFVLSLKAGGTGLTLTAASHVLHVDRWWNPAVEDQATDRVFRIGQSRNVQVRKLVCAGTLEERISALIMEKRGLAARIVGTGEGWLTELSTEQLRELVTLDAAAAVAE
ncbi:MAG TPA: DEAD/DEAH box helicase [Kineosporiaceae bacterium]|nr:DEAD/DEAH box helicase [Kineosporiaceae bacterium]